MFPKVDVDGRLHAVVHGTTNDSLDLESIARSAWHYSSLEPKGVPTTPNMVWGSPPITIQLRRKSWRASLQLKERRGRECNAP